MQKTILLVVCLFWTNIILADSDTPVQTIKTIGTGWGAEAIYITTNENEKVENCEWPRLRLNNNHPYFNQILSLALSAFHAKSKVIFRVSGCTNNKDMNIQSISLIKN